jgi:hypothetical protein
LSSNTIDEIPGIASTHIPSGHQNLFIRYFIAILIDLIVLNLMAEYWGRVILESFTISLIAALMLQVLLQITLKFEHRVAEHYRSKSGVGTKVMRLFSAWAILFVSKLVILWLLDFTLGDALLFTGPMHGVGPFIVVVVAILAAEELVIRFYRTIGD